MIVNAVEKGWEIIYHRGHALLAAELAAHWRAADRPERWIETLAAIMQHDDMEREREAEDHLTPIGTPRDFTMGRLTLDGPTEITDVSQYRGRWVAMLSSMHMSFLFEPQRGTRADLDAFLDAQQEAQKQWRRALKVKKGEAENAYALMQWADRLSLILCQRQLPTRERALEISEGPDGVRYDVMQRNDGSISVTPWPFDCDQFTVRAEASYLSEPTFASNKAFQQALKTAPIKELSWEFCEDQPAKAADESFKPAN